MVFKFTKACSALALVLCMSSGALAADTLKIGVGGAHSGELASYGVPTLNAVRLVVDEFNANGGLLGRQIEIVAADDQCKPELAPNAATSMLSQNVVGVVGMICSGAMKASLPIYNEANIVVISPSATTPELSLSGENKTFFRTIGHDLMQAQVSASFIGKEIKPKKIAYLHDNSEYGRGFVEAVMNNLKESYPEIETVLFEAVTAGASDYSAVIRKLRRENAEFLVWGGYLPEASKIINNIKDLEVDLPMLGPDGLKDENFIRTAGEAAEGVYASGPADTSANPLSLNASEAHQKAFGSAPGAFFDNGYSAAYALLNAIKVADSTDTNKIMEALHTSVVDTPIGAIKFTNSGDAEGIGMSIYQIQGSAFTPVFTE